MRLSSAPCLSALVTAALLAGSAAAQNVASIPVATGLDQPVFVTAPDGDSRLFIVEKEGRIKLLKDGNVTTFLSITGPVVTSSTSLNDERGLYSLAFHPDYANNGFFYLCYNASGNVSRVSRFSVSAGDPDLADATSETILLTQNQPFSNHNGGMIAFGQDGFLYIGFGDGGSANDPACRAQNPQTFLGKMLRIDVDSGAPYTIPAGNPFVGDPTTLDEIYFFGLRNPWRWSFDRETDDMYIGDVGQNAREEVSFAAAGVGGLNFGWKIMEGFSCFSTGNCAAFSPPVCNDPALELPIRQRTHGEGWFSLTGGFVYRGTCLPFLDGTYFYGDYANNQVWSFEYDPVGGVLSNEVNRTAQLAPGGGLFLRNPSGFGEDGFGELYVCDLGTSASNNSGEVFKIVPVGGFSADKCVVSASASGAQNWTLRAGSAAAGSLYIVAGTLSGTTPGFNLPAGNVPLNPDAYFNQTLILPSVAPLVNSLGMLDASGNATAAFDLGLFPLPPSLVGTTAHHAFATISMGTAGFISNAVAVEFQP